MGVIYIQSTRKNQQFLIFLKHLPQLNSQHPGEFHNKMCSVVTVAGICNSVDGGVF